MAFRINDRVAVAAIAVGLPGSAWAQNASSNLDVSAVVAENCTISAAPVAFGAVNVIGGAAADADGAVTARCTNGTYFEVSADAGQGSGANHQGRKMTAGGLLGETLTYNLYVNSSRSVVWGDGFVQNGFVLKRTSTGGDDVFTIYGRVAAGQQAANAGSYSDVVIVTIRY